VEEERVADIGANTALALRLVVPKQQAPASRGPTGRGFPQVGTHIGYGGTVGLSRCTEYWLGCACFVEEAEWE